MKRIPTLDGWRGIAIAMVLFGHIQDATHSILPWSDTGQHGVMIFFVLSGFLITSNLLAGSHDLKNFYVRRFFRLMPVVWAYLAFLLTIGLLSKTPLVTWAEIQPCLLFYRNYAGPNPGGAMTGHFWSLSIEEQFYLVWPSLLLLFGLRRCRWLCALAAVGIAIFRWCTWQHYQQSLLCFRTEVRADALCLGCLLALLLSDREIYQRAKRWSKWLVLPSGAGFLLLIVKFDFPRTTAFESACIAVLIAASTLYPSSLPSRFLSCKPLVWLGQVSYSVYVWQEPFMWFKGNGLGFAFLLMFYLPIFALGSYYLVERPCTRFGRRLTSSAPVFMPEPARVTPQHDTSIPLPRLSPQP
ncbi:MAG TPA: acyltransferase [Terracidiphilus sp.]|nr:acyltransferase [Terracidiphilus sp.]